MILLILTTHMDICKLLFLLYNYTTTLNKYIEAFQGK